MRSDNLGDYLCSHFSDEAMIGELHHYVVINSRLAWSKIYMRYQWIINLSKNLSYNINLLFPSSHLSGTFLIFQKK